MIYLMIVFGLYIISSAAVFIVAVVKFLDRLEQKDEQLMQLIAHQDATIQQMLNRSLAERKELEDRLMTFVDAAFQWSATPQIQTARPDVPDSEIKYVDEEVEGRIGAPSQA